MVIGNTEWGADRRAMIHLYIYLVRSKLDNGSIVYGSARKYNLQILDLYIARVFGFVLETLELLF